jgi:hypothetical protein
MGNTLTLQLLRCIGPEQTLARKRPSNGPRWALPCPMM